MPHDVLGSVPQLLSALAARPTPALTWYGPDGDRVDLSGRVSANWITKATNLLMLELSAGPGTRVSLELPAHWRTLVWAHATWAAGAQLDLGSADVDIAIRVDRTADEPGEIAAGTPATADDEIFVPLPALARRVEDLPAEAIDGAADLMTQPDGWILPPGTDPLAPTGLGLSQTELLAAKVALRPVWEGAGGAAQDGTGEAARTPRVLLDYRQLDPPHAVAELLRTVPSLWARGASVVGIGAGGPDADALLESEAVTHLLAR